MGNCFSKNSIPDEEKNNTVSSKNRFKEIERNLGEKETVTTTNKQGNITLNKSSINKNNGEKKPNGSRQLGGNENNVLNVKEAAAKAAEDRYQSKQQQLETSKEKLKAASKLSRAEKGL